MSSTEPIQYTLGCYMYKHLYSFNEEVRISINRRNKRNYMYAIYSRIAPIIYPYIIMCFCKICILCV